MPALPIKSGCTGCGACMQTCGKQAIRMVEDNEGFLVPSIDAAKCVECGLCEKRCHVLNLPTKDLCNQKTYAVINYLDRKKSSSGGAFSMFARYVISEGGIVFGAAYDPFPVLRHISITNMDELPRLQGSKYFQSDIADTYKEAKQYLVAGRKVLYTGTPCQIGGLYSFLGGKTYDDLLITLDLACHGVPSQRAFTTYITKLKDIKYFNSLRSRDISGFRFRKLDGWTISPAIQFKETKGWHILEQEGNVFMKSFFCGTLYRECCFSCQYANCNRIGTYTIADFWGVGAHGVPFNKNIAYGVSLVIDNQGKLSNLKKHFLKDCYIEERTLLEAKHNNQNFKVPTKRPQNRTEALNDFLHPEMSLLTYAKKYNMLESPIKHFIRKVIKCFIDKLHLYYLYKTISYKLGKIS